MTSIANENKRTGTPQVARKVVLFEDDLVVVFLHVGQIQHGLCQEQVGLLRVDLRTSSRHQFVEICLQTRPRPLTASPFPLSPYTRSHTVFCTSQLFKMPWSNGTRKVNPPKSSHSDSSWSAT